MHMVPTKFRIINKLISKSIGDALTTLLKNKTKPHLPICESSITNSNTTIIIIIL